MVWMLNHPTDKQLKDILAKNGRGGLTKFTSKYYKLPSANPVRERHQSCGKRSYCMSYDQLTERELQSSRPIIPKKMPTSTVYRQFITGKDSQSG